MKKFKQIKYIALLAILLVSIVPFSPAGAASIQPRITGEPQVDTLDYHIRPVKVNVEKFAPSETYGCTLLNQNPQDEIVMVPRQAFDMTWVVQNTGDAVWHAATSSYAFYGGTPMYAKEAAYQIPEDIMRGGKLKMTIDFEAPKEPGLYTTYWAILTGGNTRVCRMYLTVIVK